MGTTAAFFDIDGTLYREGMITAIFKKLIKSDIISQELWYNELKERYDRWDKRIGNYDDYLVKMAELYIEAIKGLHQAQIEFIAKKVIQQKGDRVYTFIRERINWHKEQGHRIITVSGSPFELVREMSIKYGFDDYFGSQYEIDSNARYTGNVFPLWDSENKRKKIGEIVNLYDIELDKSYGYGDTAGDFQMLKLVGNPVAMNPTRELLSKITEDSAIKNKIMIVVERKDMVYKLNPDCLDCSNNFEIKKSIGK